MYDERHENGVKIRVDGKGDQWADAHRTELGNNFLMQDLDAMFGFCAFGHNTGERLFLEYVPDEYENRNSALRKFGFVAMFDRKNSERAAFSDKNFLSSNLYRYICRSISAIQPIPVRFFYVIGGGSPPWEMVEVDTFNGKEKGSREVVKIGNWRHIWQKLGLVTARDELMRWAQKTPSAVTPGVSFWPEGFHKPSNQPSHATACAVGQ